jgi:ATP-binding cassette subfamily C (CFTR/MRP) protein 4
MSEERTSLKDRDLFTLEPQDSVAEIATLLEQRWAGELRRAVTAGCEPSLRRVFFAHWRASWAHQQVWALVESATKIATAWMIGRLTLFFSSDDDDWIGYAYVAGIAATSHVVNVAHHMQFIRGYRHGSQMKIAMISLAFRKSLRLSALSINQTSRGQITNLMSTDAAKFEKFCLFNPFALTAVIEIPVVVYLLWEFLGVASLGGVVVIILHVPLQYVFGKLFSHLRAVATVFTDVRVQSMEELIAGIRIVRMFAWEAPYKKAIMENRKKELSKVRHAFFIRSANFSIFSVAHALIMVAVIGILFAIDDRERITADNIFASLALFYVLKPTITVFIPFLVEGWAESRISIRRLVGGARLLL